ncbi:hypothetical protein [Aliidiomarina sanyensis]|uniref:hypothetical protein n=1 Tax=Aliidiomarina sanyensis TaxID=1249555 RepID=UPI0018E4F0A4|nr:hypothetical protein [Aliidiomarina sanyensis]
MQSKFAHVTTASGLKLTAAAATVGLLAACTPAEPHPQDTFFETLLAHCGNAYEGHVSLGDPELDDEWINSRIVIEVRECSENRIRIPLHVGDDHSRTWVITRTTAERELELKHDHRLEDGSHDPLTLYGGHTISVGTATQQSFPADDYSKRLFAELGYTASIDNTWIISFPDQNTFRYRLAREGREFQVDVDLTETVEAPQAPWGWEDNYQYPRARN